MIKPNSNVWNIVSLVLLPSVVVQLPMREDMGPGGTSELSSREEAVIKFWENGQLRSPGSVSLCHLDWARPGVEPLVPTQADTLMDSGTRYSPAFPQRSRRAQRSTDPSLASGRPC